ncbi:MAG: hypothetical protein U1E31_00205 [Rickettsiales bacterium]
MPGDNENNSENKIPAMMKDIGTSALGLGIGAINPVAGAITTVAGFVYNHHEAIGQLHNARIKDDAENYREYGNNPHLNFDPIAPLAGHYNNTNIPSNISSFNNALSKAIIDDTHYSQGTMSYSEIAGNSGGGVSISCELI